MSFQQDIVQDGQYRQAFAGVAIYGVAGTNGSGKDSLMELLAEKGFFVFNTSASLRPLAQAAFHSTNRGGNDTPMGKIANVFRSTYPGGMVELGLLEWLVKAAVLPAELQPKGLVIGSIRGTGEVARLKEFGGKLLVTDADPRVRFERLAARRRADDPQTFEGFQEQEAAEMAVGQTDPTKFGMAAVIEQADVRITNDGSDMTVFKQNAAQALGL